MTAHLASFQRAPGLGATALTLLGCFLGCGSSVDSGTVPGTSGASASAAGSSGSAGGGGSTAGTSGNAGPGSGGEPSSPSGGSAGANANAHGGADPTAGAGAGAGGGAGSGGGSSAGANAGGGAGTSAGACSGLFCEDFEHGDVDPLVWDTQTSGGQTVAVESLVVAHGKYAAQFHAKPNIQSYDFIITKNAPAALRGHHFGRAYFNVSPKPPAEHTGFLFAGTSGFPKLKYLEVAGIGSAWQLTYVDLIAGGESYASGGSAPDARWICLEWEFNDTPDQATVLVDGAQSYTRSSITFNGQSSGLVGGFSDFGFGYYAWHPANYAFDIYYDDIVLDTKRVGCLAQP